MNFCIVRTGKRRLAFIGVALMVLATCAQIDTTNTTTTVETTPGKIAITLDDLPFVMPSKKSPQEGLGYVEAINASLKRHGITATGFAVGQNVTDQSRVALQAFADAGHTIGNHSWSHPDYGTLSATQFRNEIAKTDAVLSEYYVGKKFYRFPFLREGDTVETKETATRILSDFGYTNVPVTIDNDEWQFNATYIKALAQGKSAAAARISDQYIRHMQERTVHFQRLAQDNLGRDVDHILLLHMNRINADHLGRLLDWYDTQGWQFITVDAAMKDAVFEAPDIYVGPKGLSQIERVLGRKSD